MMRCIVNELRVRVLFAVMRPAMGEEEEIVRSEHVSDRVSNIELSIPVTGEMSPSFSFLLFYIREDGETVADSMEFKVQPCFNNQVCEQLRKVVGRV